MHPGSPPGWESQHRRAQHRAVPQPVHPGSPPGWESQHQAQGRRGPGLPGAPRQPAGVGVSTHRPRPPRWTQGPCTPAARRGGSLNLIVHRVGGREFWCTPAARRGGSLNSHLTRNMSLRSIVHPGSPPGWESQHERHQDHRLPTMSAPRQPAGVGVSTSGARRTGVTWMMVHPGSPPGWESQPSDLQHAPQGQECTPAARRGGSLNFRGR